VVKETALGSSCCSWHPESVTNHSTQLKHNVPFFVHLNRLPDERLNTDDIMGGATTFTMLSTTARFREANPAAYSAVLAALEEANEIIRTDSRAAAEILFAAESAAGFSVDELVEVLGDPDIRFTTTPENVEKYADFMLSIGSIENRPGSWRDLFFPEIHGMPGS